MAVSHTGDKKNGRHSILDLAPLELECLRALWPMGAGTVRDVRTALEASRPRAYTTIMTILDRMARKGIVSRRKEGRAWVYAANVSATEARAGAVRRLVEHFFAGSTAALHAHLSGETPGQARTTARQQEDANPTVRKVGRGDSQKSAGAPAPRMDDVLL